jgi:hypothetical protein
MGDAGAWFGTNVSAGGGTMSQAQREASVRRASGYVEKDKTPKPPPPVDLTEAVIRELAAADTDRRMRETSGRSSAFLARTQTPAALNGSLLSGPSPGERAGAPDRATRGYRGPR